MTIITSARIQRHQHVQQLQVGPPPLRKHAEPSHQFVIIASRVVNSDKMKVILRCQFDGDFDAAKRHATTVASAIADRFSCAACCDVTTFDGFPVFSCTAGAR